MSLETTVFAIIVGTLAALVYTPRVIVNLDRKMSKIMKHMGISEK